MSTKREIYKIAFQDYITTGQTDHEDVAFREAMREQLTSTIPDLDRAKKTIKKLLLGEPSSEVIDRLNTAIEARKTRVESIRNSHSVVVKESALLRKAKRIAYMKAKHFIEIMRQDPDLEPVKEFTIVFGTMRAHHGLSAYEIMGKPQLPEFGLALFIPTIHLIAADTGDFTDGKSHVRLGPAAPFIRVKEASKQAVTLTYAAGAAPNPRYPELFGGQFSLTTIDLANKNMQILENLRMSNSLGKPTFHAMVDNRYGGYVNGQWKDCSVTVQR